MTLIERADERLEKVAFAVAILVGLVSIWSVPWFPTVDGPVHVYIVHLLDQLADPGAASFHKIFEHSRSIDPNLTVYGVIWALSRVMPMLTAEKVFVSLHLLIFAGSAAYAIRAAGGRGMTAALLLMPFALGYFLHYGFYNFSFSQSLFLLTSGFAIRHMRELRPAKLVVLSLLTLLLTLTHLVGMVMFVFYVGLFRAGVALRDWLGDRSAGAKILRDFVIDGVKLVIAALPALVIIGAFVLRRMVGEVDAAVTSDAVEKIKRVVEIAPIYAVDKNERLAFAPYVLAVWGLLAALAWTAWRDRLWLVVMLPLLAPPAVIAGIFMLGSFGFAQFDPGERLLPFAFLMLIMALAAVPISRRWRYVIAGAVVIGVCGAAVIRVPFYRQINTLYQAYAKASPAPRPSAAFAAFNSIYEAQAIAGHPNGWRLDLTEHFPDRFAREHDLALINNNLLDARVYGYFPVRYRPASAVPATLVATPTDNPPLRRFEAVTGLPVCQVQIWPRTDLDKADLSLNGHEGALLKELRAGWTFDEGAGALAPMTFSSRQTALCEGPFAGRRDITP